MLKILYALPPWTSYYGIKRHIATPPCLDVISGSLFAAIPPKKQRRKNDRREKKYFSLSERVSG